jgi:hypothetical protein
MKATICALVLILSACGSGQASNSSKASPSKLGEKASAAVDFIPNLPNAFNVRTPECRDVNRCDRQGASAY